MLNKLSIKNVALIENAEIFFTDGLNVMSGETGAGKSIVIDSLNFALGAKADKSLIRSGADFCSVCAEFDVADNQEICRVYDEFDFEKDDILIISRKFTTDGKNAVKVNGNAVNVSMLKKFTSKLADIHGQSEHYELLGEANQLKLIDKFGGNDVVDLKKEISDLLDDYKNCVKQISELGGDESQRLLRLDVLEYQIKEIKACNLKADEEEELLETKEKLGNRERITSALASVKAALSSEGGAGDILANAVRMLNGVASFAEEYFSLADRLNSVFAEADDIAETCGSILDDFEYPEISLEEVETRLETIKKLKKKYGSTYEEIQTFLTSAEEEKDKLAHYGERIETLTEAKRAKEKVLDEKFSKLTETRKKYGEDFCVKVLKELRELGMPDADFVIDFSQNEGKERKYASVDGEDCPKFLFSANSGEKLKPLSEVISGGEISRFMLAVKAQSAKYDTVSTYIFDEIDAGISGKTASVVAEKLYKISRGVQVIAITHLPQIASFADNSLFISKSSADGKTVTDIKTLKNEERVNEIIRLVGGDKNSASAREHSLNLIKNANEIKQKMQK